MRSAGTGTATHSSGFTDRDRLRFYHYLNRIYQTEKGFGGDVIDAVIVRSIAIGRIEERPMDISSLAAYLGLPRQTISRRIGRLTRRGLIAARREGKRTVLLTTARAREYSRPHIDRAIQHTIDFVDELRPRGGK